MDKPLTSATRTKKLLAVLDAKTARGRVLYATDAARIACGAMLALEADGTIRRSYTPNGDVFTR